ncbi:unnamed protein product [Lactuca virosa]|uniref:Uncharacterized protein n=1 Tax=Lactuca virosa TaxID=75947 RepID=A0AAU9MNZ2_9ASTR|nr:unnamed protein product [Lactuca virosa]
MEGMNIINEVSTRTKARTELLAQHQIKTGDAIGHRLTLTKELEEKTHQFESLKLRFTEKVSELQISCSDNDVRSKIIEEELVVHKGLLADRDAQTL